MTKYGHLLKKLSPQKKRVELDKIFTSVNNKKGIELLVSLKLDKYLGFNNLDKVVAVDDLLGIWAQIDSDSYIRSN